MIILFLSFILKDGYDVTPEAPNAFHEDNELVLLLYTVSLIISIIYSIQARDHSDCRRRFIDSGRNICDPQPESKSKAAPKYR